MAKTKKEDPKSSSEKKLVIVESPTKAKTIRKFLGREYTVQSCMGHIRDLPESAKAIPEKYKKEPWAHLGVNVDDEFDPIYCIPKKKEKVVSDLKKALSDASELILATDEDREGESISWHLLHVLKPKVPVRRIVFHEITKDAIQHALESGRKVDEQLVKAQEARRILDRLVGYTISPLIWKKIAYGLSAGRVQSVAVKLIAERELDRLQFKSSEFWSIEGNCEKSQIKFVTRLLSHDGKKVVIGKDFDGKTGELISDRKSLLHLDASKAKKISDSLKGKDWVVGEVEEKPVTRKPAAPFITSTLQQEANRKLGLSAREAMNIAQKLYEEGFITYMRTDSTFLSDQAIKAARSCIAQKYGKEYLPKDARKYEGKKVKGAQEAHEAIRPAGAEFIDPDDTGLKGVHLKLYELIWMRTVGSQMVDSRQKQTSVKFNVDQAVFTASGMIIEFPGFLRAYVESEDEQEEALSDREVRLPALKAGEKIKCISISTTQHETRPPSRFTEAGLVQTMEREGIGRPSTYAAIIGTIVDRGYVRKVNNALIPTFTALVVSRLLQNYLPKYVDLKFTSEMEKALDDIAEGDLDSIKYLKSIYFGNDGLKSQVAKQEKNIDPDEARAVHLPGLKGLEFRVGRYGAYVSRKEKGEEISASIPENQSPGDVTVESVNKLIEQKINGADALGKDPATGKSIYVLSGRFGPYVQLGENDDDKVKLKRISIPPNMDPTNLSMEQALKLLALPKSLGEHPDSKKEIKLGLGRFGPYVVCDGDYRSIPKTENFLDVDLKRAIELFAQEKRGRGKSKSIKDLGKHPDTGDAIQLMEGKYGPYIKSGKTNVSLGQDQDPKKISLDEAIALLAPKLNKKAKRPAKVPKEPKTVKVVAKATPKSPAKKTKSSVAKDQAKRPSKTVPIRLSPQSAIRQKS